MMLACTRRAQWQRELALSVIANKSSLVYDVRYRGQWKLSPASRPLLFEPGLILDAIPCIDRRPEIHGDPTR